MPAETVPESDLEDNFDSCFNPHAGLENSIQ